jgi:hypothetical protein
MNSQDIHNLQESYRRVYEQVVPDPTNNRPMGTPRVNPDSMRQYDKFKNLPDWQMRNLIKDVNYGQQVKGPEKKLTTQVAHLDLFDLIKGHLLDEGYADTEESALVIMANMSEEWRQSIVEQSKFTVTDLDRKLNTPAYRRYKEGNKEYSAGGEGANKLKEV